MSTHEFTHEFTNVPFEEGCECWTCRAAAALNKVPMNNNPDEVMDVIDLTARLMVMVGNGNPQEVTETILPVAVQCAARYMGVKLVDVQVKREDVH